MKEIKIILSIALIAMVGLFTACEDEETTATLDITPKNVPDSIEVGVDVTISFSIIVDNKIESIELRKGTKTIDTKTEGFTDNSSDTYSYTGILADTADAGKDLSFAIILTDNKDNKETYNFEITVKEIEVTGDPIETYSDKILGSYSTSEGSSFASIDGTVYQLSDAANNSEKVDLLYYYGSTNLAVIAAPDDSEAQTVYDGSNGPANWSTINSTRFTTTSLSANDFDAIDDDLEIVNAADGADQSKATELSEGDVIAFMTASTSSHPDKKGLIKVNGITGTGGESTIDITVKIQE